MATEDFITYTSHDENSDLTITPAKVDVATLRDDASAYVYTDKGAGHFADGFSHDFEMYWIDQYARCMAWCLSNDLESYYNWYTGANNAAVGLLLYGVSDTWYIWDFTDGSGDSTPVATVAYSTLHYCTASRSGNNISVKFYSDAARTNLLDTITTAVGISHRYIYAMNSYDNPNLDTDTSIFHIQNLDLNEEEEGAVPGIMRTYRNRRIG